MRSASDLENIDIRLKRTLPKNKSDKHQTPLFETKSYQRRLKLIWNDLKKSHLYTLTFAKASEFCRKGTWFVTKIYSNKCICSTKDGNRCSLRTVIWGRAFVKRDPVEGRLETKLPHANDLIRQIDFQSFEFLKMKIACGKKATSWNKKHYSKLKETSAFWGITLIYLKKMNLVLLLKNVCDNKHLYLRLKTCLIPLSNEQCTLIACQPVFRCHWCCDCFL